MAKRFYIIFGWWFFWICKLLLHSHNPPLLFHTAMQRQLRSNISYETNYHMKLASRECGDHLKPNQEEWVPFKIYIFSLETIPVLVGTHLCLEMTHSQYNNLLCVEISHRVSVVRHWVHTQKASATLHSRVLSKTGQTVLKYGVILEKVEEKQERGKRLTETEEKEKQLK